MNNYSFSSCVCVALWFFFFHSSMFLHCFARVFLFYSNHYKESTVLESLNSWRMGVRAHLDNFSSSFMLLWSRDNNCLFYFFTHLFMHISEFSVYLQYVVYLFCKHKVICRLVLSLMTVSHFCIFTLIFCVILLIYFCINHFNFHFFF